MIAVYAPLILGLAASVVAQGGIPIVECSDLTETWCDMYCQFTQTNIAIAVDFPEADYQVDYMCGTGALNVSNTSDLLTCWACDATGVNIPSPMVPGSNPTSNSTLKDLLTSWARVCDTAWTGNKDVVVGMVGQGYENYPTGYECIKQSSGKEVFTKAEAGAGSASNGTSTKLATPTISWATSSRPLMAGGDDAPTGTNSSTGPRLGGDNAATSKMVLSWIVAVMSLAPVMATMLLTMQW